MPSYYAMHKEEILMPGIILNTLQWVVVPSIMGALFIFAIRIAGSMKESELKASSWAGFWAGLVIFIIYVIS